MAKMAHLLLWLSCMVTLLCCSRAANINWCPQYPPVSTSINALGSQLVKQLKAPGNYFVSPLSVHSALAMTYLGASSDTASELESAFKLKNNGLNGTFLHQSYSKLLEEYGRANDQYSLLVANGAFLQKGKSVRAKYRESLENYYKAVVKNVDFEGNGDAAKDDINGWVAGKTNDMIQELLSEPLDPATRLVLLNAVYFKGTWKVQFDKEESYDAPFWISEKQTKRVKFMALRKEKFRYYEDPKNGHQFLEMPYKGEDIVMLLALPKYECSPHCPETYSPEIQMSSSLLCAISRSLVRKELEWVKIPKFRLEYTSQLKNPLKEIGIKKLFSAGEADLSGISDTGDLYVSDVLHKAVIDVNEEGSEAAAVTGVVIENRMGSFGTSFIANKPFLFYIVDKGKGVVLFSGRVVDPSG